MALTKTIVANQALQLIGAQQITDFAVDDGTPNWDSIQLIYDSIRQEVLVEFPWSFAQRRVILIDITNPSTASDDWLTATAYVAGDRVLESATEYVCLVPHTSGTFSTDLTALKWTLAAGDIPMTEDNISRVYTLPATLSFLRGFKLSQLTAYHFENMLIDSVATAVLLAATEDLKMIYIYDSDDPALYFPSFVRALVYRLASELTLYVNESNTTKKDLDDKYEKIYLPKATSIDSQHQGTPEPVQQYEWDSARQTGGGGIFPPFPGAATWHSIWGNY